MKRESEERNGPSEKTSYSVETHLIYGESQDPRWDYSHHLLPPISSSATFRLDSAQRGAHRSDLRHDINAIALVLDHAGKPPHLALDAVEPLQRFTLAIFRHDDYIYPQGV